MGEPLTACPIRSASHDLFRIIQNLLDARPEPEIGAAAYEQDWIEARTTVDRIKDRMLDLERNQPKSLEGNHEN